MIYTTGIILSKEFENQMLILHPTNAPKSQWSIPKGECLYGFKNNVLRELKEETNISIPKIYQDKISYIGTYPYVGKDKCLVAYSFTIPHGMVFIDKLKCNSMVNELNKDPFPEIDEFKWVRFEDALQMVHYTQQRAIIDFKNGNI